MKAEDIIRYSVRRNYRKRFSVKREYFVCMEINIPLGSRFMKNVSEQAERIIPRLNLGKANSSERRDLDTVEIDNLSGIIAEAACMEVMDWRYGRCGKVRRPESCSSYNQVDLKLYNDKTIEVRSSCVRNGIDFALFARNAYRPREQYFDVIGPYSNDYKKAETYKDYYMRVLYECEKKNFMKLLEGESLRLYITGGATRKMMMDPECCQIKHLVPAGGEVRTESDYRVIPLAKSLDIREFFSLLERENEELKVMRDSAGGHA